MPAHEGRARVGLAVHERPDTDALGAAAGMLDLFAQLGVEARLHVDTDELLPLEEYLLPFGTVTRGLPPARRPLYALDCGSLERLALPLDVLGRLRRQHRPSSRQHALR